MRRLSGGTLSNVPEVRTRLEGGWLYFTWWTVCCSREKKKKNTTPSMAGKRLRFLEQFFILNYNQD